MTQCLSRLIVSLLVIVGMRGVSRADVVERRGAEATLTGEVTRIDDDGVRVRSDLGATHFVPWDHVRNVRTTRSEPALERFLVQAEDIWRARTRLERGDWTLAEPLFARLFESQRGRTNETALVVAEGLLRCRIARGANTSAVIPALEVARMRRAGISITTSTFSQLAPILDDAMFLCPELPPVWVQSRQLLTLERDLVAYDSKDDVIVDALRDQYLRAVRWHLRPAARRAGDGPVESPRATDATTSIVRTDHPGVAFLEATVTVLTSITSDPSAARTRLARDFDSLPAWAQAWSRFANGASLIQESGVGRQQRGMVELLHIPARHSFDQPFLAGLALAWVETIAMRQGDARAAAIMREELDRNYSAHPARSVNEPVALPSEEDIS